MTVIDISQQNIKIPFKCPICGGDISLVYVSEYACGYPAFIVKEVFDISIECLEEPDPIEEEDHQKWESEHYPYKGMNIAYKKIIEWLNSGDVAVVDSEIEKQMLQRWISSTTA